MWCNQWAEKTHEMEKKKHELGSDIIQRGFALSHEKCFYSMGI